MMFVDIHRHRAEFMNLVIYYSQLVRRVIHTKFKNDFYAHGESTFFVALTVALFPGWICHRRTAMKVSTSVARVSASISWRSSPRSWVLPMNWCVLKMAAGAPIQMGSGTVSSRIWSIAKRIW